VGVRVESLIGHGTRFILLFEKDRLINERRNLKMDQRIVSRHKTLVPVACMA